MTHAFKFVEKPFMNNRDSSTALVRTQTVESARADAERVRLTGAAEARAIEAVGRAEAEKMRMKASAYKQYGDAAIMALVLEALPQVN